MKLFNKEKNIIKVPFNFNYTELTAIEEYLTQQEEKGFRLKEINGGCFVFEKAEPRTVRYCAEIYTGSFSEDFKSSCAREGWRFVDVYNGELFIFRTQDPYASEIMTDENEKFKTIAKRVLLQPGYLGLSGFAFFCFLNVFVLRTSYDGMIETNIVDCLEVLFIICSVTYTLVKLFDFTVWYLRNKSYLKKGEKILFLNLKESKQNSRAWYILRILYCLSFFAVLIFLQAGYTQLGWELWFFGGVTCASVVQCVYDWNGRKNKGKEAKIGTHVFAVILAVVVIAGVYGTVQYGRQMYAENFKNMLNNEGIPVSLSNFGVDEKYCTDETKRIDATRFAQHYYFSSEYEKETDQEEKLLLWYEVFVSDSAQIRRRYINQILKKYEEYDTPIMKIENTDADWDEYYREFHNGAMTDLGYAVKGNTVVFVDICWNVEDQDFFEVAYEKLFPENE